MQHCATRISSSCHSNCRGRAGEPSCVLPGVSALLDALERASGRARGPADRKLRARRRAQARPLRFVAAVLVRRVWRSTISTAAPGAGRDLSAGRAAGLPTCPAARVVIIGDTPLDVDCARTHGARALAVATGHYNTAALSAAGADLVVPTLEDTPASIAWMLARSALSHVEALLAIGCRRNERPLRGRHRFVVAPLSRGSSTSGSVPGVAATMQSASPLLFFGEVVRPVGRVGLETDLELVFQTHVRGVLCKKDSRPLGKTKCGGSLWESNPPFPL